MTQTEFQAMTVPLRAVVQRADLGVALLSGPDDALDRQVRWAHVSELPDPMPYLLGSELLLCCGVDLVPEPGRVDRYVRGLVAGGVSALGFGVTPVFDAVPGVLAEACERHALPLLEIPEHTPFLAVCRAVGEELTLRSQAALRRLTEAQLALTSAAAQPDPRGRLLAVLGEWIGGWAALLEDPSLGHDDGVRVPAEVRALAERVRAGSGARSGAVELPDGTHVVVQPVNAGTPMLAVGKPVRFDVTDRGVIAVGLALLGVFAGGAGSPELAPLTTRLLTGGTPDEARLAEVFGRAGRTYRVLAFAPGTMRAATLTARLGTSLVDESAGLAVVDEDVDLGRLDGIAGVSRACAPAELADAAREARLLAERAVALGRSLHAERADTGLGAAVDPVAARRFAERLLAPLDERLGTVLRTWLAQHGNWDRTAAALGVHRNSVRHRIGRIERLLDVDLADPQTRMELWFALQWR